MIIEQGGRIYHDEHDIEILVSNDNTKHLKVVKVKLRGDIANLKGAETFLKKADQLYKDALGS